MSLRRILACVALAIGLTACATRPPSGSNTPPAPSAPSKEFIKTSATLGERVGGLKSLGVIVDVCIRRDETMTDPYYPMGPTKRANELLLSNVKQHLSTTGYQVNFVIGAYGCAVLDDGRAIHVSTDIEQPVSEQKPPLVLLPEMRYDAEYGEALRQIVKASFGAIAQKDIAPTDHFKRNTAVGRALAILQKRSPADAVLLIVNNGASVSSAKTASQQVTQQLLTAIVTLGRIRASRADVSFMDGYAGLIALSDGELLWSNSFRTRIDPLNEKYYSDFPKSMLYHLPAPVAGDRSGDSVKP